MSDKKLTQEQINQGNALIKKVERNDLCPCNCGKKVKKCENGRRVLQYKRMLTGSVFSEVLVAILFVGALLVFLKTTLPSTAYVQEVSQTHNR